MSATPRASVIVVNYNGREHVDVCLDSLLKQTYANYEVVFVDNGSTDGSLEHARARYPL
jgi:glycosyltransferase involved in cell wall biosynthesis